MKTSLLLLSAGLAGTIAMTIFLLLPRWLGRVHVDVIQAGGFLVVGSGKPFAFPVGLAIHIAMGIGFAFVYPKKSFYRQEDRSYKTNRNGF